MLKRIQRDFDGQSASPGRALHSDTACKRKKQANEHSTSQSPNEIDSSFESDLDDEAEEADIALALE